MQTNPAVEQSKIIRWSESPWNQSGRKGKGLLTYVWLNDDWITMTTVVYIGGLCANQH